MTVYMIGAVFYALMYARTGLSGRGNQKAGIPRE
jgi:hypothetical protein